MARTAKNSAWNEVIALVLLGVGTLLFLALISYAPKEIPTWFPPQRHFLAQPGAKFSRAVRRDCRRDLLFSGRSRLLFARRDPARLWRGEAFPHRVKGEPRIGWIRSSSSRAPVCFSLQHWFLRDWPRLFYNREPGGWIGDSLGRHIFRSAMGRGSVIVLGRNLSDEPDFDDRACGRFISLGKRCRALTPGMVATPARPCVAVCASPT